MPPPGDRSPGEAYRALPDWPMYVVGSGGNVWSRRESARGEVVWKKMKGFVNTNGYKRFVAMDSGRTKWMYFHQAVLLAFIGPPQEGHEVCHKDGDRLNNRLENLYWGTRTQNVSDAIRHGTAYEISRHSREQPRGQDSPNAKLSDEDVREIRRRRAAGERQAEIAKRFGISQSCVSMISRGLKWGHVE